MNKILLLILLFSLSSCSLFNNSKKKINQFEKVEKIELEENISEKIHGEQQQDGKVKSKEQKQITKDIDEETSVTADSIEVKKDGGIVAKGNAKLRKNIKDKSKQALSKAVDSNKRYISRIKVDREKQTENKQEKKVKLTNKEEKKQPNNTITIWLAIGVIVLIAGLKVVKSKI
ncbi:hypothetical protein [Sphingobacterium siyangense]|uniref:hypothetical protein n=1 Tax=Sphingobacterium siyangense TaxID=459529 RepID=UPI003DA22A16